MATKDDSDIPESGAVFTFGKSKFADNLPNKFWVKNDKVLQIACGDEHTALVTESGRVFMFGPNDWGQLGLGNDNKLANKPSCIKSLKHDKSRLVACGRSHTIISTVSGHVYSCGSNSEGQLGIKDISDLSTPKRIESLPEEEFKMLDAGSDCSVALTEDGRVYVWGGNEDGKLGVGKVENAEEPILLAMERPAVCVACGYYHTAIVTDDGKLYTMGESEGGKLGLPEDLESTNVPQHVSDITDPVKWVACGSSHTVALTQTGDVYVFGDGDSGQLGLGTDVLSCSKPTLLKLPFKVTHVFCGQSFTACISEKGQLYTFGDGRHGKLAHGSDVFSNQFKPFHSKRFTKFLVDKVACGGCHMIVTARPKALNGVEEDDKEEVDEMKKTLISQPVESFGSPSLTRTLSARERRRDEVSRSFSSELNQTLPPPGQSRILPSLSATMPALKSSPKPVNEDTIENGFVPQLQNGKISDADSGRDDTEDEDHTRGKHKKRTKLPHPKASPRRLPQSSQQESLRPLVSPRRALTPRSSDTKTGILPPVKEGDKNDGVSASNGSGSDGDTEDEDNTDGAEIKKKKKKNGKKRKSSKAEEESIKEEKAEDSWNDDDAVNDEGENKDVKELESALVEKDGSKSDEDKDDDMDSVRDLKDEEEEKEEEVEDEEEGEKSEEDKDKKSRGPVPVPRKQKNGDSEDNEEEMEEEKHIAKKDSLEDLQQESDKDKEEEKEESEKESKMDEEIVSDKEDEKKSKKDKKDKDKKKKKDKEEEEEEDVKEKKDDDEEEEEKEEKEDSKKKGKDKKKDKKDKKKDKDKDKKKKKGKDDDEEEDKKEDDVETKDKEDEDKKSKDKKIDKKDNKKDKDKGDEEDEKEDEDHEENEKEDKKKKDKDKKEKDKKKKGKGDDKEKDENGNTEKPPPKKSRTCNIL